jgi:hypothetical protein
VPRTRTRPALFGSLALSLAACGPSLPTPPPPTVADPSQAWNVRLGQVVSPQGLVDYAALRADPKALRDFVGWAAAHGPEADKWRLTDDNRRLAYSLNVMNALTLWAVVEGVERPTDRRPFGTLRFSIDDEVVRADRYLSDRVLAIFEEPLAVAALGCAARACPPVPARLFTKVDLDIDLAAQMSRWIASGRLVRANGDTLVFSPALRPWTEVFERHDGAATPCDIVAPYVPKASKASLEPLLQAGTCRYTWGVWDGALDGA